MGGFFSPGSKEQNDITTQTGASEESILTQSGSVGARDEAVSVGGTANLLQAQGAIYSGGPVTVNATDGGAFDLVRYIAGQSAENFNAALATVQEASAAAAGSQSSLLTEVLGGLTSLSESKLTDGESTQSKTVMIVALAIAAVAAVYFWKK